MECKPQRVHLPSDGPHTGAHKVGSGAQDKGQKPNKMVETVEQTAPEGHAPGAVHPRHQDKGEIQELDPPTGVHPHPSKDRTHRTGEVPAQDEEARHTAMPTLRQRPGPNACPHSSELPCSGRGPQKDVGLDR